METKLSKISSIFHIQFCYCIWIDCIPSYTRYMVPSELVKHSWCCPTKLFFLFQWHDNHQLMVNSVWYMSGQNSININKLKKSMMWYQYIMCIGKFAVVRQQSLFIFSENKSTETFFFDIQSTLFIRHTVCLCHLLYIHSHCGFQNMSRSRQVYMVYSTKCQNKYRWTHDAISSLVFYRPW